MKNMSKGFRFVVNNCLRPNARPRPTVSNNRFNEQVVEDRISVLFKNRLYAEALEEFDFVQKSADFPIRISSYAYLICACSSLRSLELGRRVHGHMVASKCEPDIVLRNHIVNMYAKCGSLEDARKVFDEMPQRNVVSWTALMAGYVQNGRDGEAVKLYLEMLQKGLVPDGFTFGNILRACSGLEDVGLGRQVHAHVLKSQFGSHQIAQDALISMYTKLDQIEDARDVFSRIESKDLISWGSIISGFCKHGHELEGLSQFREMLRHGVHEPNEVIFGNAFNACRSLQQPEYGRQIHGVCIKFGFGRDPFAGCSVCDMYAKCGYIDSASTAFHGIANPDSMSWNAMISGLVNHGKTNEATSLFSQMMQSGLIPNKVTVLSLLCAFTNPSLRYHGMLVHSYIIKMGFNFKVWVCNALITMYSRCSSFYDAYNVFNEIMHIGDLGSWDAIFSACAKHKHIWEVFRLFKLMLMLSKVKPDHSTLTIVLRAHSNVASLEMGNQIHCYTMKTGLSCDVSIMNVLIDMYMKCGSLGNAHRLFDSMKNPDIVSWSSLIMGYAQFGHGQEALELYRTMRTLGVTPNEVTMVGVLTACNHAGFVEEGWKLYRTMETELGITPTREHCTCVVDMLARSGYVKEAEVFITQFPFDPDIVVWKMLLAACRAHKQVEIGERAAENILNINPSDSGALGLLSNIYAGCNRWEDVARLRRAMKQRGVKKIRGQSWIEVKDRVHVFVAKDELHPEKGNIYSMLDKLWLQMLDNGYVPFHNQPACEAIQREDDDERISDGSETFKVVSGVIEEPRLPIKKRKRKKKKRLSNISISNSL